MKRVLIVGMLVGAVLAVAPRDVAAQNARNNAAQPRPNRATGQLTPAEVAGMLDAYAVVQAQDALHLTDAQYGPFVTRLRKLQETRRRNQQSRNQLLQDLRQLAGVQATPPYDEAAIRERMKSLRDHDDRSAAELKRACDAVDEVLDVPQQARFRIFEETIERRKLDLLMRARQGARRGGKRQKVKGGRQKVKGRRQKVKGKRRKATGRAAVKIGRCARLLP